MTFSVCIKCGEEKRCAILALIQRRSYVDLKDGVIDEMRIRFSPEQLSDLAAQIYFRQAPTNSTPCTQTGASCYPRAYQAGMQALSIS